MDNEAKPTGNLDQDDYLRGVVKLVIEALKIPATEGRREIPIDGVPRPHRAVREMSDKDLLAAIDHRPDFHALLDEQARRDLARFQAFRNKPDLWHEHISRIPWKVLELLDRHTMTAYYHRELSRRMKEELRAAWSGPPLRKVPDPAPAAEEAPAPTVGPIELTFEEAARRWLSLRQSSKAAQDVAAGRSPSSYGKAAEAELHALEATMHKALERGDPIQVDDKLFQASPFSSKVWFVTLRRGSDVTVRHPAEAEAR